MLDRSDTALDRDTSLDRDPALVNRSYRALGEPPFVFTLPGGDVDAGSEWLAADDHCDCSRDDLLRALTEAPPLRTLVSAAYRAAGIADDPVPGWARRSRWSVFVPAISARVGNSESWREVTDPTVHHAAAYDVRVAWRLERLLYDPNEPRFTAFDLARRRERRRVAALATRVYFMWVRARAARRLIEAGLAGGELDAMTDGWFSEWLANARRSR